MTINVALAGAGAFGIKHLDAIKLIPDVKVVSLVSRELAKTQEVADKYGINHVTTDLADSLKIKEVDAVILCTPTQMHAAQTTACLEAGKHVQVEIPLCDKLADGERVVALAKSGGKVAMCGHTRRFNPSHQWVRKRIAAGEFNVQQMDVQTYFFRRTNMNALGQARSWTTPRTPWTCSRTRRKARSSRPTRSRARSTRRSASRWTCRSSSRPPAARSAP
jgi:2-hydroxy-4-carboxymuconate semialdehyde hemiacetal dehydrogenase